MVVIFKRSVIDEVINVLNRTSAPCRNAYKRCIGLIQIAPYTALQYSIGSALYPLVALLAEPMLTTLFVLLFSSSNRSPNSLHAAACSASRPCR